MNDAEFAIKAIDADTDGLKDFFDSEQEYVGSLYDEGENVMEDGSVLVNHNGDLSVKQGSSAYGNFNMCSPWACVDCIFRGFC